LQERRILKHQRKRWAGGGEGRTEGKPAVSESGTEGSGSGRSQRSYDCKKRGKKKSTRNCSGRRWESEK